MGLTSTPDIATFQPQNPAKSGCASGWRWCTCFSCAMLLDIVFFGQRIPAGCTIGRLTGDTSGGTTLPQNAAVAREHYGVTLEVHVGSNVCRPSYAMKQLRRGRPFILQGNTHPLLSTKWRSTRGSINHAVIVMKGKGWHKDASGNVVPKYVYVGDPAADHHYNWIDQGPSWWPYSLLLQFAAALRPWGDDDPRTLGREKMYAAFAPPPRVTFRYGGTPTGPSFPDVQRVDSLIEGRSANVRSRPTSMSRTYIVDRIPDGRRFAAYQKTRGVTPAGSNSDLWYGDWTGTRWIHSSNLIHEGGDT